MPRLSEVTKRIVRKHEGPELQVVLDVLNLGHAEIPSNVFGESVLANVFDAGAHQRHAEVRRGLLHVAERVIRGQAMDWPAELAGAQTKALRDEAAVVGQRDEIDLSAATALVRSLVQDEAANAVIFAFRVWADHEFAGLSKCYRLMPGEAAPLGCGRWFLSESDRRVYCNVCRPSRSETIGG